MTLFFAKRQQRARESMVASGTATGKAPFYIFLLPTCCDVLGTGIGGVGMLYVSASVWQMMRGSLMFFASLLTVTVLRRKLNGYNWVAVAVSAAGLVLVG